MCSVCVPSPMQRLKNGSNSLALFIALFYPHDNFHLPIPNAKSLSNRKVQKKITKLDVKLTIITGNSHDGRDYQLCTITNAHREKRLLKPLKHLKLSMKMLLGLHLSTFPLRMSRSYKRTSQ
ncbi:hypothetical protein T01_14984 [Trichinella spiralis]|uniref:Uncharacterized protein n=1 Tax=Trichinella spiralis TaxID=6334 RepID=A0A0V1BGZ3_TRISP|nr:hypothetical protein T01_14984 [Trichinella spiralis]